MLYSSSALATDYAPIYIYMSLMLVLGSPLISLLVNFIFSRISKQTILYKIMNRLVPPSLKPINFDNHKIGSSRERDRGIDKIKLEGPLSSDEDNIRYFNQCSFIVNIVSYTAIMATIGVIMPSVGICICLCLPLYIHNTLSSIGDRLKQSNSDEKFYLLQIIFERDSEGVYDAVRISFQLLLPVMGIFYSLFIYDTLGDVDGGMKAIWSVLYMSSIPFLIWVINKILMKYYNNNNSHNSFDSPLNNDKVEKRIFSNSSIDSNNIGYNFEDRNSFIEMN